MLHINARHPDAIVPPYLKDDHHLRINLSYRFRLADLTIDEHAVSATLSFQRQPFHCVVPFSALWGLSQPHDPENLILFPEALPIEMLALAIQNPPPHPDTSAKSTTPTPAPLAAARQPAPATPQTNRQPAPATPQTNRQPAPATSQTTKRPILQLVVDQEQSTSDSPPTTSSPTKRPTLRLVKTKDE